MPRLRRGLKLAFSGQTAFLGDEVKDGVDLAEGPAIPLAKRWCASALEWSKKLHAVAPGIKTLIYLHPAICTEPGAEKLYADCQVLDQNGQRVTSPYRYPVYEYLLCRDNAYGKAMFRTMQWILDELKADGIYMDEISGGSIPAYAYQAPWDGCTVEMDPQTHAVVRQCSSTVLLGQSWKSAMVEYLRGRGGLLVGNGPARTRTMLSWKMPLFTELNSYSFLIDMHLSTPLALGNHDNENNDRVRARMVRRALDYAGVLCIYSWGDRPEGFHYAKVMYPITPTELRPGVLMGQERILTNRSGRFGWPDGSRAQVYVFDADGKQVQRPPVKETLVGGRRLYEIRLPAEHFAVLVRKARTR